MTLNDRQEAMLRSAAHEPKELRFFTHGTITSLSPLIAKGYADEMEDLGLWERGEGGKYHVTDAGIAYLSRPSVASTKQYGSWSTPAGSLRAPSLQSVRPGADDHKRFSSRGF